MNTPKLDQAERILGCIVGGAIGDCLGGPYEGKSPAATVSPTTEWRLSDDTQMTLATCEAIAASGTVDPASIAASFAAWHRESRITGLGRATFKALSELVLGGHWALVGMKGEMAAGNGAAMRIAPLAFCFTELDRPARQLVRDVCRITHHNEEAYVGGLAVILAIRAAVDGRWAGDCSLAAIVADQLPDSSVRDNLRAASAIPAQKLSEAAAAIGCSGYVAESVPVAIFAAQQIETLGFEGVLNELIVAGGDTDTTCSLAGQMMGALIGHPRLPTAFVNRLPDLAMIERISHDFAGSACASS